MKKTIGMLCMLLVTLGFVSGCQGRQEASSSDKTITVRDAKGEVEIPAEPKRIVDRSPEKRYRKSILTIIRRAQ